MKTVEHTSKVAERIGGNIEETEFKIKASPKAFEILSKGIYGDPVRPPVRELATNGLDSMIAARKKGLVVDRPFEVHLPSLLEPWFSVRDFGVGMSNDEIKLIYNTYFESTKTESNDYVGCLGLGSKSPFCYTDTFSVISIQNGVQNVYTAFLENGVPKCAHMDSSETGAPDGMLVQFSVDENDFERFAREAKSIYSRFIEKPLILNHPDFEFKDVKYRYEGTNWGIRDQSDSRSTYAIMGNIAYPITYGSLNMSTYDGDSQLIRSIISCGIDLTFGIGELEIAASRENLHFDDRTVRNIKKKLLIAYEELIAIINKKFSKCKNRWEALITHNGLFSDNSVFDYHLKGLLTRKPFKFKNSLITGSKIRVNTITDNTVQRIRRYNWTRPARRYNGEYNARLKMVESIVATPTARLVVNDLKIGGISRIKHHVTENKTEVLYLISEEELEMIRKPLGYKKSLVMWTSKMEKAPVDQRRKNTDERMLKSFYHRTYRGYGVTDRDYWTEHLVADVTEGEFMYIPIRYGSYITSTGQDISMKHFQDLLQLWKSILPNDPLGKLPLLGVPIRSESKFKKMKNWINVLDHITPIFQKKIKDERIYKTYLTQQALNTAGYDIETLRKFDMVPEAAAVVERYNSIKKRVDSKADTDIIHTCRVFNILPKSKAKSEICSDEVSKAVRSIFDKYPMLKYIEGRGISKDMTADIKSYVELF